MSKTQLAFLELLQEGPADETGLSICGGNARTSALLERRGLIRWYSSRECWKITAAGTEALFYYQASAAD